jgi:acyl-coenzyme A synthetase/AMP-(fatty) acid ligase
MNLFRLIFQVARTQPHVPALIDGERTFTFRELAALVARTAGHLAKLGMRPGDRVGVCLNDNWTHVVAMLAIGYGGAVIVPMDWRARPREKAQIAELLSLKLVLIDPEADIVARAVAVDADWHAAVDVCTPLADTPGDWNAPLLLAPTAGTTGVPKYSLATHLQFYFRVWICNQHRPARSPARYLSTLPLYFAGSHLRCLAQLLWGDTVVMHPTLLGAGDYVAAVAQHGITVSTIVPTLLRQLLQVSRPGEVLFPNLLLHCAGAPLFAEEKEKAARQLTPGFMDLYGNSALGGIARLVAADIGQAPASVGRPYPIVIAEIVDEDDRPLATGAVGRLRVRSPALGTPVALPDSPPAHDFRDGWYYPGEFSAFDERYFLYIKGRASDVIMRGGAKIYPAEIEAVLQEHDAVVEAAVLGLPAGTEEHVIAFVMLQRPVDSGALLAHCRTRLTAYKVPREIHVVADMPRNTAGKVVKADLAALRAPPR